METNVYQRYANGVNGVLDKNVDQIASHLNDPENLINARFHERNYI